MKKKGIYNRLFKVISDFSKPQIEEPLPSLEEWEYETNTQEKRAHLRKDVSVDGIFKTTNSQFRTSTKNVSEGGVLIDPETHPYPYEYIYSILFHRKFPIPLRASGIVVRIDSDGVGIKFNKAIPVMSSL